LAPEINGQYRSNGARKPVLSGQCCRSRSATFDRRIAARRAWQKGRTKSRVKKSAESPTSNEREKSPKQTSRDESRAAVLSRAVANALKS
jgi:hypothetical protein